MIKRLLIMYLLDLWNMQAKRFLNYIKNTITGSESDLSDSTILENFKNNYFSTV